MSAVPLDPGDIFAQLQRMVALVPGALLAIVILAGPTATWLLYRFVVQPRTRRFAHDGDPLLWICSDCRSANEVRHSRCYRCGLEREAIAGDLQVLDGDGLVALPIDVVYGWKGLPEDAVPEAVPPGPVINWPAAATAAPPPPARTQPLASKPRRLVAVGPGRLASDRAAADSATPVPVPVTRRRRRSVAAGPAPASPPADDAS